MKQTAFFFLMAATLPLVNAAAPDGEALYKQRCGTCHDSAQPQARVPTHAELAQRTPEFIYRAMFDGAMLTQSAGISPDEGRAIARFITGKEFTAASTEIAGKCPGTPGPVHLTDTSWNGWGNDPDNARYQPKPGLTAADVPKLKLKWAYGFPNESIRSAQPTVVGDRVFVGSSAGSVYSLDAKTGCVYWKYDAGATVRTAISIGKPAGRSELVAYFGDTRSFTYALDAATGKELWKVQVEDHPASRITGAPTFYNGRLYVPVSSIEEASAMAPTYACCKFRGSVVALDGATGKQVWKSYSVTDPPKQFKNAKGAEQWGPAGAAIWSSPTIDVKKKVIYAATGNSYTDVSINTSNAVLAFDLESGRLLWSSQVLPKDNFTMGCGRGANCPAEPGPDFDFGTSPVLRELPGGKRVLVAGQKSGILWGLDPDDRGKVLWQTRLGKGSALGGIEWGHSADDQNAYAAVSDLISAKPGGIHAVNLATGEKIWSTPAPPVTCPPQSGGRGSFGLGRPGCTGAQSAAISTMPGVVFSGSVDGHFRAYSTKTGEIVWDFNTVQDYQTVNGVPGKGGSLDSAGPTIADGMVFTNSGYGLWQGLPGNVLLAFSVDGK
ncbi:MAG TPA: PQQ-binding-like beta-propeller repeat protein [Bryobacteraceae bacterium]|nr:PQQ-binding-like beta-propeller repeat protein [Bryobacteraceae bacterium]